MFIISTSITLFFFSMCHIFLLLTYTLIFVSKESLMDLSRQLQDALTKESLIQKNKGVLNKITIEQLVSMSEHFRYIYIILTLKIAVYFCSTFRWLWVSLVQVNTLLPFIEVSQSVYKDMVHCCSWSELQLQHWRMNTIHKWNTCKL